MSNVHPFPDWRRRLIYNHEGVVKPRLGENAFVFIRHHPDIAGCFAFDEIRREISVVRALPFEGLPPGRGRPLSEADITGTVRWLERLGMTPARNMVLDQIVSVAELNPVNHIRDYLEDLEWDNQCRLATLPKYYLGSPPDEIYAVFLRKYLVSAVARIMQPGCKVDCMPVFEGKQGGLKSTFLRRMATVGGTEYFTDALHDIESKDVAMQLARVWFAEIPEWAAFLRKGPEAVKSWISRTTEQFRPPYGRIVSEYPRQCVFAGTLNPVAGYLADASGARRFWPIPVGDRIDIKSIEKDKDQIWAEVVAVYRRQDTIWHLTADEAALADGIAAERYQEDPWEKKIDDCIANLADGFTTAAIIAALDIPAAQQNRSTSSRIAAHLSYRGYVSKRSRATQTAAGSPGYQWEKKPNG